MVIVDTSVWVDHLRGNDAALAALLAAGRVLAHPFVVGEIALGQLRNRAVVLDALGGLPAANTASAEEVLVLIESTALAGLGIGYVDAHLLAATRLTPGARLWTRDKRLREVAQRLGLAADEP